MRAKIISHEQKSPLWGVKAFTLVELVVVAGIVAILVAIAIPLMSQYIRKTRIASASSEIRVLESEIAAYHSSYGFSPTSLTQLHPSVNIDPWGTPYQFLYIPTADHGEIRKDASSVALNTDYDLYSKGSDKISNSALNDPASLDDIVRGRNGSFIGRASDY